MLESKLFPQSSKEWDAYKQQLRSFAQHLGFAHVGFTHAQPASTLHHYEAWLAKGYHGEMRYLAREDRLERRRDLNVILPGVQSLIFFTLKYWPGQFPKNQSDPRCGVVSCYAWGEDYHKHIDTKLKTIAQWLEQNFGGSTKRYVDTGAIQERDLGARAGLGFIGKNTMLIHPRYGSGFFIGELLSTLPFPPDRESRMPNCGTCTQCLVECPTQAFVAPYILDARRCISYLTIELKGSIPISLRPLLGNMIYGCDICQQVCPWNRFAGDQPSPLWGSPSEHVTTPKLLNLIKLTPEQFQHHFANSPIRRIGHTRLLRNVAVALGNTHDASLTPHLVQALQQHNHPLLQEHLSWSLQQLHSTTQK
ncbi:MAG: tRNA epoxyqueuosine(34) reductase QueG [Myxococcota bacterium]